VQREEEAASSLERIRTPKGQQQEENKIGCEEEERTTTRRNSSKQVPSGYHPGYNIHSPLS